MAVGRDELIRRYRHHLPRQDQPARYQKVRDACLALAEVVDDTCPDSAEKDTALDRLDEVMFHANAAIARRSPA